MFGRKSEDENEIEAAEPALDTIEEQEEEGDPAPKFENSAEDALRKLDIMAASDDAEEETEALESSAQKEADSESQKIKHGIYTTLMEKIDLKAANLLDKETLEKQIITLISEITVEKNLVLNQQELTSLAQEIADDMLGHGPLEPLLDDDSITDIMVNGADQVYVERHGKLELSGVKFRDNAHVMNIAQRIVTAIGRRVDESTPVCDARLADGSRVNVIAPPLALRGCTISIRKFAKKKITLDIMAEQNNISEDLCKLLKIATASRLNIIISGGTGSGKTTLLNALSRMIDHGERIVTIEDAAELQLQQPHVVPLETRPANLEKEGEITMQDLVKNALRMRPDRVILGEVRGGEAMDMLQAMNTGHDGSLGTLHANNPREALTRLENMVNMAGYRLPSHVVRHQISSAVQLIVQIQRMRDGMRRVTHVTEVIGMEGDVIVTQDLYTYNFEGVDGEGNLIGEFKASGLRPNFITKAEYFGLDKALLALM
ncbi:MAG: CpaF family protein [Rickettsiales bacterium]|nr:CpaF family protein [Rickettsiales bacterium]